MKKKYLALIGVLLAGQIFTAVPASAAKSSDKEAVEETEETEETDTEAAEEEASEEEAEENEETEETTEAAEEERPEYDFHDYLKKLGKYEGLTAQVEPKSEITEEMINNEMNSRVTAEMETLTEGEVQNGDIANIDYVGKRDDVAFDGGTAQGYNLTIGSGSFIEGFEEGLIGVKVGDTVDLNLTFPENYHSADLAGAEVVFTVTVNSIQRAMELSDEAIDKFTEGQFKDKASYEVQIRKELEEMAEQAQQTDVCNELMDMVLNDTEFEELPQEIIEFDTQRTITMFENMLYYYYGTDLETYCSMSNTTVEEYEAKVKENAELNVKYEIIERAILEAEGIELTDDLFMEMAAKYAEQRGYETEKFLELSSKWDVWRLIYTEKTGDIILEKNTFEEI